MTYFEIPESETRGMIMMKFSFFNDTGRVVTIHPASGFYSSFDDSPIQPLEIRTFKFSSTDGDIAVKMWDYGERHGLQIFVHLDRGDLDG